MWNGPTVGSLTSDQNGFQLSTLLSPQVLTPVPTSFFCSISSPSLLPGPRVEIPLLTGLVVGVHRFFRATSPIKRPDTSIFKYLWFSIRPRSTKPLQESMKTNTRAPSPSVFVITLRRLGQPQFLEINYFPAPSFHLSVDPVAKMANASEYDNLVHVPNVGHYECPPSVIP